MRVSATGRAGSDHRMFTKRLRAIALLAALTLASAAAAFDAVTPWERDPEATPRYAETVAWCRGLAEASDQVAYGSFGISPQGRDLPLVIWDRDGLADPEACRRAGRVVLLVQACIHAGESCGKDAGMGWIRDLAGLGPGGAAAAGPAGVTVLFVPIFNVDGHERFGPHHRINQNGPREMGWRVTAQNLNLNRDFYKADTPEMQAWLQLWNAWDPHFLVDVHATDGADYQYAITYGLELHGNLEPGLTAWLGDYLAAMETAMAADGYPLAPYVTFRDWHDPRSGLGSWVAGPRYSQGYAAIRNRPGLLIETHMLKPYPVRVRATRAMLDHTLAHLAGGADRLRALTVAADALTASPAFRAQPLPLRWERTEESEDFTFLGVEYEQVFSDLSGGDYFVYHPDRPDTFVVPWFNQPAVSVAVEVPEAYLVPPEWTGVIARLQMHGVRLGRLAEPVTLTVDTWRFADPSWGERPYEGRHQARFELEPVTVQRTFPAGAAVVDMAQPAARAAVHGLDPRGPDSFAAWGFFDAVMTRVEYVESYVIERIMKEMVAADPDLAAAFDDAKAADPDLASDPWRIRQWFYERTPYHDAQAFVYPVGLLKDRAVVAGLPLAP